MEGGTSECAILCEHRCGAVACDATGGTAPSTCDTTGADVTFDYRTGTSCTGIAVCRPSLAPAMSWPALGLSAVALGLFAVCRIQQRTLS